MDRGLPARCQGVGIGAEAQKLLHRLIGVKNDDQVQRSHAFRLMSDAYQPRHTPPLV